MRIIRKKSSTKSAWNYKKIIKVVVIFIVLLLVYETISVLIKVGSVIKRNEKITFVVRQSNDDVHVHIIDPKNRLYNVLLLPSQTLVNASHGLGEWRIGSLWKQGLNDKLGGEYLRKSMIREFNIPVLYWADHVAEEYFEKNIGSNIRLLTSNYLSNMDYSKKLVIYYYSLKIADSEKNYIDLKETAFIKPAKLPDGEEGYVVNEAFPQFLLPLFSQENIANSKIKIINNGINETEILNISKTIETLGGKVAFIEKRNPEDYTCKVWGTNREIQETLSKLFTCVIDSNQNTSGFDLVLSFGKKFSSAN